MRASRWITVAFFCWFSTSRIAAEEAKPRTLVPLGLPDANSVIASNPRLVEFGTKIFFDKTLSADGRVSCASCHDPSHAFSDSKPISDGAFGRKGERHTPSILNSAFNTSQFWDGRSSSLQDQALQPFTTTKEYGLHDINELLTQLNSSPTYQKLYRNAFPKKSGKITSSDVAQSISAFEETLLSGNSDFDRYTFGNDSTALTSSQIRGLAIFKGAGKCASCHLIESNHALFTDSKFHNSSIGMERLEDRLPSAVDAVMSAHAYDEAAIGKLVLSSSDIAALGRFVVTKDPKDIGQFKTPALRNVAIGGPYMHDGSVNTLAEAVDLETYQRTDASGRPIILTPVERLELLDFLTTLTGRDTPLPLRVSREAAVSHPAAAKAHATATQAIATSAR